ncbi:Transporter of the ATP-binding cassette (ABC), partial [Dimargaris xerosporica]
VLGSALPFAYLTVVGGGLTAVWFKQRLRRCHRGSDAYHYAPLPTDETNVDSHPDDEDNTIDQEVRDQIFGTATSAVSDADSTALHHRPAEPDIAPFAVFRWKTKAKLVVMVCLVTLYVVAAWQRWTAVQSGLDPWYLINPLANGFVWHHIVIKTVLGLRPIIFPIRSTDTASLVELWLPVSTWLLTVTMLWLSAITEQGATFVMVPDPNDPQGPVLRLSPEHMASYWDSISFGWLTDILVTGYHRVVSFTDLWHLPSDDLAYNAWNHYRKVRSPAKSLFSNLAQALRHLMALQATTALCKYIIRFGGVYFMNRLLDYIQDPGPAPKVTAYMYAAGMFFSLFLATVCTNKSLFYGRHMAFRINGILAGEVARKALQRQRPMTRDVPLAVSSSEKDEEDDLDVASTGRMMNLVSADLRRIAEASAYLMDAMFIPITMAVGVYYLYRLLGFSSGAGLLVMALSYPFNQMAFSIAVGLEDKANTISDRRISAVTELLNGMRIVKLFGWEPKFMARIRSIRQDQLKVIKKFQLAWCYINLGLHVSPIIMLLATFGSYTLLLGHPLTASTAFTTLAVFQIIDDAFFTLLSEVQYLISSRVSLNRMQAFLSQPDLEPLSAWVLPVGTAAVDSLAEGSLQPYSAVLPPLPPGQGAPAVGFDRASFSWAPTKDLPAPALLSKLPLAPPPDSSDHTPCGSGAPSYAHSEHSHSSEEGNGGTMSATDSPSTSSARGSDVPVEGGGAHTNHLPNHTPRSFAFNNLTLRFPAGHVSLVVGPTGSGKTSLLLALLGEMPRTTGHVLVPATLHHLVGLAYVAQEAWLRNATIRENIVFGERFDEARYRQVLVRCALVPDLALFPAGDATEIGEKGVTLSGGQKQRIALARAMYSSATVLLLDDCLSAVDSHTAQSITRHCLQGPLMQGRTCVLVTHQVKLCLDVAQFMVVLSKDQGVVAADTIPALVEAGVMASVLLDTQVEALAQVPASSSSPPTEAGESRPLSVPKHPTETSMPPDRMVGIRDDLCDAEPTAARAEPTPSMSVRRASVDNQANPELTEAFAHAAVMAAAESRQPQASPSHGQLVAEEEAEQGSVKVAVYKAYMQAAGSTKFWAFAMGMMAVNQLLYMLRDYWIRVWVMSTSASAGSSTTVVDGVSLNSSGGVGPASAQTDVTFSPWVLLMAPFAATHNLVSLVLPAMSSVANAYPALLAVPTDASAPAPGPSVGYFLTVYALIGLAFCVLKLLHVAIIFAVGSLRASKRIHQRLLQKIVRAKPQFFESTPVGRVINRFSGDMRTVDENAMDALYSFFFRLVYCVGIFVVIILVTPTFAVAAIGIVAINVYVSLYFLSLFRELKRIESIRLAPLLSLFSELTGGITTIRAYGVQSRYIATALRKVDDYNRPFYLLWAINRWLQFRTDMLGACVTLSAALLILWQLDRLDAGSAGFSLGYALAFSYHVYWVIRDYSEMEMAMNSMERIEQYCRVAQEAPAIIADRRPPAQWPTHGAIQLRDLTLEYKPGEPVIHPLTVSIQPGEKIGLVGRTGAGKSTLGLSFLRFVEPSSGTILVDDIDITRIGLDDLRHRITMIPQDPVLFEGTLRSNLDPFDEYDDGVIWDALRSTHLVAQDPVRQAKSMVHLPGLTRVHSAIASESMARPMSAHDLTTVATSTANANRLPLKHGMPPASGLPPTLPHPAVGKEAPPLFDSLEAPIAEGGQNLSLGQRQLVALARALVRQSKVIIMDEATASVDFETDHRIQQTIRQEFATATLVCIAHRLRTIIDYDRVMVLDRGHLVEFAKPLTLLHTPDSLFRAMCEKSGELDVLLALAQQAEDGGQGFQAAISDA